MTTRPTAPGLAGYEGPGSTQKGEAIPPFVLCAMLLGAARARPLVPVSRREIKVLLGEDD